MARGAAKRVHACLMSFSERVSLARGLFSSQFFGGGREWVGVHWHNLMNAEGGGGHMEQSPADARPAPSASEPNDA
eukprot:scaffold12965_cov241-Isochrysis_galbana.AAC.2